MHLEAGRQVGEEGRLEGGAVTFQSLAAVALAAGVVPEGGGGLLAVKAGALPQVAQQGQMVATMEGQRVLGQAEGPAVEALS